MKLKIQKNVLAKALSTVGHSVSNRATLPALSGVMIEVDEHGLTMSGSNLETAIRVNVPMGQLETSLLENAGGKVTAAEAIEEGVFLTPARLFSDFIGSLPDRVVTIETANNVMTVSCGKIKSTFAGLVVDEYPELGFEGHVTPYTLPGGVLAQAIEHVGLAASTDDARAILTGLHVHVENGMFELAATDGFRLALEKVQVEQGEPFTVVIPARVMVELARLIREHSEQKIQNSKPNNIDEIKCGRTAEGTQMLFVLPGGVQVITRLLEGTFPPYQKIIPKNYATAVLFDVEQLSAEIKRAALFGVGGSNMLRLEIRNQQAEIQNKNGIVIFSSGGSQVGEYSGEVEVEMEGSENKIAFNAKYLLDFLTRVKAKQVRLEMNRVDTPGLWRVVGLEEFIYVVMPMNL